MNFHGIDDVSDIKTWLIFYTRHPSVKKAFLACKFISTYQYNAP